MPLQYTFGLLGPFRVLALENSNATLFYTSKKPLYHYTILFYDTFTFQTSTSLFYSLK